MRKGGPLDYLISPKSSTTTTQRKNNREGNCLLRGGRYLPAPFRPKPTTRNKLKKRKDIQNQTRDVLKLANAVILNPVGRRTVNANERKCKSAKERLCVKIANNQVQNNHVWAFQRYQLPPKVCRPKPKVTVLVGEPNKSDKTKNIIKLIWRKAHS